MSFFYVNFGKKKKKKPFHSIYSVFNNSFTLSGSVYACISEDMLMQVHENSRLNSEFNNPVHATCMFIYSIKTITTCLCGLRPKLWLELLTTIASTVHHQQCNE